MILSANDLAMRYVGMVIERQGTLDHPLIQWWLSLCGYGFDAHDEIAWCSAFVNGIAWELRLPRSKSAAARSWLTVGTPVALDAAVVGFDVVILQRGGGQQPGPEILKAPGHVGWFAGRPIASGPVQVLAGNQGDAVSVAPYPVDRILGIRRLA